MKKELARKGIMEMPVYVPGKSMESVQREYGLTSIVKLASNENPLHTSPKAVAAMREELDKVYMYPEPTSPMVQEAVSRRYGIPADCVYVANGGDHTLTLICEAFLNEGEESLCGDPSFITYHLGTSIMGGKTVFVPLNAEKRFDLQAILDAITEKTKLIFLCNPNNPTGTILKKDEVEAFMQKVPDRCVVVFDEAYYEFVEDPEYAHGLDYVRQGRNVIVMHTFSKVYGLAGMRIGYLMTTPELMKILMQVLPPFPVNRVAQAGAAAAMTDDAFISEVLRNNHYGREYFYREFSRLGMEYTPSQANYVFVDTGLPAAEASKAMLKRGVIVRPGGGWGFPTCMRITVGTPEENRKCVEALEEIQKEYQKEGTIS